jgi:hypothetical protein
MQQQWERLQLAEARAQRETERLCKLYDCYEWEIEYERKRPQNQRKEILPYLYRHLENGVEPSQEELFALMKKHKEIAGDEEGELEIDLETKSPAFLEELLQLLIRKAPRIARGQRMQ